MKKNLYTFLSVTFSFFALNVLAQENLGYTWSKVLNNSSPAGGIIDGRSIKVDADGNTYVAGFFYATADFDPGSGTFNLTSAGAADIFIAKYDASNNLLFAKAIGSSAGNDSPTSLFLGAGNNIYVTGYFEGAVDFDPGAGSANLTSAGGFDIFLAKYDTNGNLVYAKRMGGTSSDQGNSLAVDASGNSYITGRFVGTADFDPGAGTANLFSVSGSADIFIAKYDVNGNYVFAKRISGTGTDAGESLVIDAANNIYITGNFQNTVDFDPGAGTANLTSVTTSDTYFAKYTADGDYVYAKQISGSNSVTSFGMAIDGNSNLYITGNYSTTADFDPGAGIANLTAAGSSDVFFAKYDTNGNYVYAKTVGGTNNDAGFAVTADANGNVYVAGYFSGTADLDAGAGTSGFTSNGNNDFFFAKYDASGNYVYAKSAGGTGIDRVYSIAVDNNSKVYVTGSFRGTVDFDPGAGTATLNGPTSVSNCFIAAYDASGNYSYAGSLGGYANTNFQEENMGMVVDNTGNVYITGYFNGSVDFDPGAGTAVLASAGNNDIYFAKYSADGNLIYAKTMGGSSGDVGYSIAVDASNNVYVTGTFQGTVDFDPGGGIANLTSTSGSDVFIAKYDANGNYVYAFPIGGSGSATGFAVKSDDLGNTYVGGYFSGTFDFDPAAGVVNLTSAGSNDFFITKYDALGNYVFAKAIGNSGIDILTGLAIDGLGNIYVTGYFQSTVDFDPGAGTANLTATGILDLFLAKYDASGNYVYAKKAGGTGGTGSIVSNGIAVDVNGNAYLTGSFNNTIDFDPGAGTVNLTASGSNNIFIAKYDASGNYVYAHKAGTTGSSDGKSIVVDNAGNVYATGYFQNTVDFDPGAGTANLASMGNNDIFLVKYDAAGNYVNAKTMGSTSTEVANNIALDGSGNIVIAGVIISTADFDPGAGTAALTATNSFDVFIAKYSICSSPSLSAQTISASPAAVSGATSLTDGGCRLLAVVEPNGASPVSGIVNAQLWIESSVPVYAGQPFVARHYEITPVTNPSTATGRVTLYFTQQEFDDFNNHPGSALNLPTGAGDAAGIGNLRIAKYEGVSSNGTGLPGSYSGNAVLLDPLDTDIVWNAALSRWEVSINVEGFSGFIVQTNATTLPVSLTAFTVKKNANQSLLNWSTSSEQNNKGFVIQRSSNGRNFDAIGFVQAADGGNSNSIQTYSFTDAAPLKGRNYYRLQQQDVNGTVTYSEVRLLNFGTMLAGVLYPNPVGNALYLQLQPAQAQVLQLRLSDLQGRTLRTWTMNNAGGLLQLQLNGLLPGNYQLELINEKGDREVHRIMKQ